MENRKLPALIALAGVVIAIVVFFAFGDEDTSDEATETAGQTQTSATETPGGDGGDGGGKDKPEESAEPEVPEIEIRGGEPVGGVQEIEIKEGSELRVAITTDAADELHFHGFDVYLDIGPGSDNELVVENADIGGVHELESHTTGALFAEVSVVPD